MRSFFVVKIKSVAVSREEAINELLFLVERIKDEESLVKLRKVYDDSIGTSCTIDIERKDYE